MCGILKNSVRKHNTDTTSKLCLLNVDTPGWLLTFPVVRRSSVTNIMFCLLPPPFYYLWKVYTFINNPLVSAIIHQLKTFSQIHLPWYIHLKLQCHFWHIIKIFIILLFKSKVHFCPTLYLHFVSFLTVLTH